MRFAPPSNILIVFLVALAALDTSCSGKLPGESSSSGGGTTASGASSVPPLPQFTVSATSGVAPLSVTFDQSDPAHTTSWQWDYGDGGHCTSDVAATDPFTCGEHPASPMHTYTTPGVYTVSLVARGSGGTRTEIHENMIEVHEPAPHVSFTGDPLTGTLPYVGSLDVAFTRTTDHASHFLWEFGDDGPGSTSTSSDAILHHGYTEFGDFTVTLTAIGPGGTTTDTVPHYIHLVAPAPDPNFTVALGSMTGQQVEATTIPQTVTFTQVQPAFTATRQWNFGDGPPIDATGPTITHTFNSFGEFNVSLHVTGPGAPFSGDAAHPKAVQLYKPLLDGSFEQSVSGQPPGPAWTSFAGNSGGDPHHVIEPAGSITTDLSMPSDGRHWCVLDSVSTNNAAPPMPGCDDHNPPPCGPTIPAVGGAGISQTFTYRTGPTDVPLSRLKFDTVFLCAEDAFTSVAHDDWMSVDVSVGNTTKNIFFAHPDEGLPNGSSVLFTGTHLVHARTPVNFDLRALFDNNTSTSTVFTLTAQVGNAGTSGVSGGSSKGYIDNIRLEPVQGGITAMFDAAPLNVFTGETVQFTDHSMGMPTQWLWEMFDGNEHDLSSLQNPTQVFVAAGRKSVRLTARNDVSNDSLLIPDYVTVFSPPQASFTAHVTCSFSAGLCSSGGCCSRAPVTWHFSDTSGNPSTLPYIRTWDFDDGTVITNAPAEIDHTYETAGPHLGVFHVTLTVGTPTSHAPVTSLVTDIPVRRKATFADVHASVISAANCGNCHSTGATSCSDPHECTVTSKNGHFDPNANDATLRCQLLNCQPNLCSNGYIVANDPGASVMFNAIARVTGSCSGAMPPSSSLTADQVDILRSWIASGAP